MNIQPSHANSQNAKLLNHLQRGGFITALGALRNYQCLRLAARIHELRKMGFPIRKEMVSNDTGKKFAKYRL
jgi:hypothetical protein